MKISIITITFNSEATVRDTIESVLGQTYPDIEYIMVDGRSADRTVEIIQSYGKRIHKFVSEPDRGLYDALNKGLRMAEGDVVGFLHSDDVYADATVVATIAEAFNNRQVDSVYGDLVYTDKDTMKKVIRYWNSGSFTYRKIKFGWMPPHPTFYAKREVYLKYGGFNPDFRISADYDTILRFLHKKRITTFYIPMILVKMRLGGASNRSLKNLIRKMREDMMVMRENGLAYVPALMNKNVSKVKQFLLPSTVNLGL